jgi:hypothetical protein
VTTHERQPIADGGPRGERDDDPAHRETDHGTDRTCHEHGYPYDVAMRTNEPPPWDVEGPVRGEVFLVWLNGERLELTGPDGAAPWMIQLDDVEHPVEAVDRIVRGLVGAPLLVHSTSWRREGPAVVLSFVVAIGPEQVSGMASEPIRRAELARSEATKAPAAIGHEQVLEHGIRHLAWLAQDDAVVAGRLSPAWRRALGDYVPEPFRSLP